MVALVGATLAAGAPAYAQTASDTPQVEEIVVTAQRREESLQKVPITVTAIGGDTLRSAGVANTQQLAMVVPGLLGNTSSGAIIPVLRGIGVTSAQPGNDAPVATYIDGVYSPMNFQNTASLADISRIEVLNGPQGTLFGRNTTAGVVQIVTKDPSAVPSADLAVGYGNYDTAYGSFYGSTALLPNVAGNLAVMLTRQSKGFGEDTTLGRDIFKVKAASIHSKLVWEVTPDATLTAAGFWDERKDNNSAIAILPGTIGGTDGTRYTSNGFYNTLSDTYPVNYNRKFMGYIKGKLNTSLFQVVNIASYQDAKVKNIQDFDATPKPYLGWILTPTEETFSEELQIISAPDSKITWIAGLYYLNDKAHEDQFQFGTLLASAGGTSHVLSDLNTYSKAAYGQATAPLFGDRLRLTAGLRYTRDTRRFAGSTTLGNGAVTRGSQKASWSKLTYRLALDYDVTKDVMAYVSYNRGFKSGTFTINSPTVPPVQPEVLDSYEGGIKSQLLEHRLRVNADVFYYNYKNSQQRTRVGTSTFLRNAASATLYGAEFFVQSAITSDLFLDGGVSLLHSRFETFPNAITFIPNPGFTNTTVVRDVSGKDLVQAPKVSATLGVRYKHEFRGVDMSANLQAKYTGRYYWEVSNRLSEKPTTILNSSVTWAFSDRKWDLTVWANNLTNVHYALFINDGYLGGDIQTPAAPRTFGATVGAHF